LFWGLTAADQRFLQVSLLITAGLLGLHAWKQAARSAVVVQVLRAPEIETAPESPAQSTPRVAPLASVPVPEWPRPSTPLPTATVPATTTPAAPMASDYVYRIDINQADWPAWAQLPGIGETLARRIVAERESHGPFVSIDDLRRVKGVGVKTLEKMRPHLRLGRAEPESG